MSFIDKIYLLKRMHYMLELKCTGSPSEFAYKLGISERTLFRKLEALRDSGIDIRYAPERRSYIYLNNARIKVGVSIDEKDSKSIKGGFIKNFNVLLPFLAVKAHRFATSCHMGDAENPDMSS